MGGGVEQGCWLAGTLQGQEQIISGNALVEGVACRGTHVLSRWIVVHGGSIAGAETDVVVDFVDRGEVSRAQYVLNRGGGANSGDILSKT